MKGELKAITPDGKVIDLGECEVDADTLQPILTPEMKAKVEEITGREVVGQVEVKGEMKVSTYPRLYQVLATGPIHGDFNKVGAILCRPDGEAWEIITDVESLPRVGQLYKIPFNGHEIGFATVAKEFRRLPELPAALQALVKWSPEFTAN